MNAQQSKYTLNLSLSDMLLLIKLYRELNKVEFSTPKYQRVNSSVENLMHEKESESFCPYSFLAYYGFKCEVYISIFSGEPFLDWPGLICR